MLMHLVSERWSWSCHIDRVFESKVELLCGIEKPCDALLQMGQKSYKAVENI